MAKAKLITFTFLTLILSFSVGLTALLNFSENSIIEREIASIGHSKINNSELLNSKNIENELSKKIKIYSLNQNHEKVIALEGFSSQLCKTYKKIDLYFEAYGVSVSGESTQFKISADCIPAQDPAEIALIKIPYEKLMNEKPKNAEFKFSGYTESFEFINSDTEWNRTWVLSKIIFKSIKNNESKIVKLNSFQNDKLSQPIVLEF